MARLTAGNSRPRRNPDCSARFTSNDSQAVQSDFDKVSYPWRPDVDYRAHPDSYRVGRGEQGVLICRPYKDELVGLWRFRTADEAEESSKAITAKFHRYVDAGEFVGADMARKFLQMGFTRARRYANYKEALEGCRGR